MSKMNNKKTLILLFAVTTLLLFGCSAKPMLHKLKSCFKKEVSNKTIIDKLTDNCLWHIFTFLDNPLWLKDVCKNFKYIINTKPCCTFKLNDRTLFLDYRIYNGLSDWFLVGLHSKKAVEKFTNDTIIFSYINEKKPPISLLLYEYEREYVQKPELWIQKILSKFSYTINQLNIYYRDKKHIKNGKKYPQTIEAYGVENGQAKAMAILNKETISEEELNMFGDIKSLEISSCDNFRTPEIRLPKTLQSLEVFKTKNFSLKYLTGLLYLNELKLHYNDEIKGNELGKLGLKNLKSLGIFSCKLFNGRGINKLKNLEKLYIQKCDQFDFRSLQKIANLKSAKFIYQSFSPDTKKIVQTLAKKGCKIFIYPNEPQKSKPL